MWVGRWRKGKLGLEADVRLQGMEIGTVQICQDFNIWLLMQWLAENYPEQFETWRRHHAAAGNVINIKVSEFTRTYASQSGGDDHVVTAYRDRWTCTCPAYGFGKECWAMKAAKAEYIEEIRGNAG